MAYRIFAIKEGNTFRAIPMEDGKIIGEVFDTYEDAEDAFESADDFQIPNLARQGHRGYPKFLKTDSKVDFIIKVIL